jgi:acyl carrier protein
MSDLEHSTNVSPAGRNGPTPAEISAWIISYVARLLGCSEATIDRARTFDEIGLDSMMVIVMTEELGTWVRRDIDPTKAYDYPTIESFAAHVSAAVLDV